MKLNTKNFKEIANKIVFAVDLDKSAAAVEIAVASGLVRLNVTNKEYYVSAALPIDNDEASFRAVVDASAFLSLVGSLSSDEIDLSIDGAALKVSAGHSNYKMPLLFEGSEMKQLKPIVVEDATAAFNIKNSILQSILNVNRREIVKIKNLEVNELQRLYYIDETGCFTFNTGACFNSFTLERPVQMLLNDRIVRLFKLFSAEEVAFKLGYCRLDDGRLGTKISLVEDNMLVGAYITNAEELLNRVKAPASAAKSILQRNFTYFANIDVQKLSAAVNRLMTFTKNTTVNANMSLVKASVRLADRMYITDAIGNIEAVDFEAESVIPEECLFTINLTDIKYILEAYKTGIMCLKCMQSYNAIVTQHEQVSHLVPQLDR